MTNIRDFALAAILGAILALLTIGYCAESTRASGVVTADGGKVTELCPFSPGWNLTVLNGTPSTLPSCVVSVWRYEAPEDRWYFWGRDNAPYWNDLTSFDITKGYWVWAQQ